MQVHEVGAINPLQEQARNVVGGILLPPGGSNSENFNRALRSLEAWQQKPPEIKTSADLLVGLQDPNVLLQRAAIAVLGMGTEPNSDGSAYVFPGETEDIVALYKNLQPGEINNQWEQAKNQRIAVADGALALVSAGQIKKNLESLIRQHPGLKEINKISGYSDDAAADEVLARLRGFIKSRKFACRNKEKVKAAISV